MIMKKIPLLVLLIEVATISNAKTHSLDRFLDNRNLVLQVLGAADYYTTNCSELSTSGVEYYQLALEALKLNRDTLKDEPLYISAQNIAKLYPSCKSIWFDFKQFGIEWLIEGLE